MKCKCGNDKFIGHQIIRADVIVNEHGDFDNNLECGLEKAIYDAEKPYGHLLVQNAMQNMRK